MQIGSFIRCNRADIDAEHYYTEERRKVDNYIKDIQARSQNRNMGIAFVSFKERSCVADTLDEIDLVKSNLSGDRIS